MLLAPTNAYSEQDEACLSPDTITALESAGGTSIWMVKDIVMHDYTYSKRSKQSPDDLPGFFFDQWNSKLIDNLPAPNKEFGLNILTRTFTDDDIKHLKRFEKLKILTLNCCSLTDRSVSQLKELKSLKYLDIRSIDLTENGIAELPELKCLRYLRQNVENYSHSVSFSIFPILPTSYF